MERLILDLRGNAGGLLEQAYAIADEFLGAGEMIVYTDSRHASNRRQYRATAGGIYENEPVIVLVDENSASASEIVAGALQDHDRAYLIGRRTFGKGLVQQQFPMTDGSVLQMTVSRYYTPSGRLIQTPYEVGGGDEAYYEAKVAIRDAVENQLAPRGGKVDAGAFGADVPDSLRFQTAGGRTVYGGGGVLPDFIVRRDTLVARAGDGRQQALRRHVRALGGRAPRRRLPRDVGRPPARVRPRLPPERRRLRPVPVVRLLAKARASSPSGRGPIALSWTSPMETPSSRNPRTSWSGARPRPRAPTSRPGSRRSWRAASTTPTRSTR